VDSRIKFVKNNIAGEPDTGVEYIRMNRCEECSCYRIYTRYPN